MITARLNRLVAAYRAAKRLVGDANRGKAIPAVALRLCNRIRQAIKAEIVVVEAMIRPRRLLQNNPEVYPA
ncbi:hypothetical protein [Marinobacter oulmenensis]|uniref:Uncharacterized protein n=1 Tax=Marinobacter oulmenensis TaxID=643747 RepID=A0A840UFM5_9GAMM|nr:hypothetical protein [Marinobacter oulmenensis]MBB5321195.1 hypothetical protein [Marinobacter oulmenensis]